MRRTRLQARARAGPPRRRRPSWQPHAGCGCFAATITRPGFENRRSASNVSSPTVPAPATSTSAPSGDARAHRRVDGAREWLDQDRGPVVHRLGDGPQLRSMGQHDAAPPAARVRAVAGLQARLEVAHRDAVTSAVVAGRAVRAQLAQPARRAAQHRRQHHALARRQVLARVVHQLAHDLVARDERHGHERREVERGPSGDRGQVAPADAGEQRLHAHPVVRDGHGVRAGRQTQRRQRARHQARRPASDRAGGQVARAHCGTAPGRAPSGHRPHRVAGLGEPDPRHALGHAPLLDRPAAAASESVERRVRGHGHGVPDRPQQGEVAVASPRTRTSV